MDNGPSQKLTLSTLCSVELIKHLAYVKWSEAVADPGSDLRGGVNFVNGDGGG